MVSIVILNYNGEKFLKTCLESVLKLDYPDKEIIFLDNASTDDSVSYVMKHFPQARIFVNPENTGYAGGANKAIELSKGDFVLIMNPDIIFEPDYLNILIRRLKQNTQIGAIIGKLRKYDFEHYKKTSLIDSAGLLMFRNRRCVDRGQGEEDRGQYNRPEEVFGVTGACPLYRRKALEDSKIAGEYFDSSFFMYKEDVDISWRLQMFGWKCFYEPAALAYHGRGTGVFDRTGLIVAAKNRKNLSKFQKYHSYKNERLMRVKNEVLRSVARDFLPILGKEILMTGWMVIREPFLFKALGKFFLQFLATLKKRKEIMSKKKLTTKQICQLFKNSG